jgi:hypothetical protein
MGLGWLAQGWICFSEVFLILYWDLFKCGNLFLFCEIIRFGFPFRNQVFTTLNSVFSLFHRLKRSPLWSRNEGVSSFEFLFENKILFIEASVLWWLVAYSHLLLLRRSCDQWTETWKGFALYDSALVRWAEIFFHWSLLTT